jgi:hypothetical protein
MQRLLSLAQSGRVPALDPEQSVEARGFGAV